MASYKCPRCKQPYMPDTVHSCHRKYPSRLIADKQPPYSSFGNCLNDAIYYDYDTRQYLGLAGRRYSSGTINSFISEVWDEFMCIMDGHKDCKGHLHRK